MRPLITPANSRRRFWKRVSLATLTGLLLFLVLLPALLSQLIRYQLPRMGLGTVEISNIDLNLFRGRVLLQEVALYKSMARVLYFEQLELDLSMLSLLEQRLHIQSLTLQGLSLTLKQEPNQPLQIAGVVLPPASPASDKESAVTPWDFGIDAVRIQDSEVLILHPQFSENIELNELTVGPLATWRPEFATPVSLRLTLREGMLHVTAKSSPFAAQPLHSLEFNIDALPLASFAQLAKPTVSELDGFLSTHMTLQLQQDATQRLSLTQQGEFSLTDLKVRQQGRLLRQQSLRWKGDVATADLSDIESLKVEGGLQLSGVSLKEKGAAATTLNAFSLSGVQLQGSRQLSLGEVAVDGLVVEAQRRRDGMTLPGVANERTTVNGKEGAAATKAVDSAPFRLQIERIVLSGENRFTFDDQAVKPPFRHTITITEGKIEHLDSGKPEQATTLSLKGRDDFYTRFSVTGEIKPFAPQLSLNLTSKLNDFDMPPTSPYLVKLLGYRITTGQLDSDVTMQIENNEMKGELDLRMNKLKLDAEDPARIEEFQETTSLPLNTALSLLRDDDDNIQLKLPISGKLDDPQFDINDIINTALGRSLKMASVSYLKQLLQPYSSVITVLQMVGKAAGHIQLEPMRFADGSAVVSDEARPYLEKLSRLLEKKEVNMQLCGFATTDDLLALTKGKEKAIPPAGHPALEMLAKQRAEKVKSLLVNSYGVLPKQLFVCHPELDHEEGSSARVELSI